MISGEKIFLRAIEMEDARIISAWFNDREVNQYLDIIYPLSKRYTDSFVIEAEDMPDKKVFIIDNMDRKPIGLVIIDEIKWEYRTCQIGIAIYNAAFRGCGLGKDALKTALNFIYEDMNINLVHLKVDEDNEAALGLYKSFGFKKEGTLRNRIYKNGKYRNLISMSKTRDE